jgi:hypothetical protein
MPKADELLEKLRSEVALEILSELRTALDRIAASYKSSGKVGIVGAGKKSKTPGKRTYRTGQRGIFPKWVAAQEKVKTAKDLIDKHGIGHVITEKQG